MPQPMSRQVLKNPNETQSLASHVARVCDQGTDPRALLMASPMSRFQWLCVLTTVGLCALDGFDVLAITFTAPSIVKGWGITKIALGYVFSAGLFGMAGGSFLLAPLADRIGRRPLVLTSLAIMAAGSLCAATAANLPMLLLARVLTGVGVGAMIAVINPLGAEYANERRRELAIGMVNVGYPLGGVAGGIVASLLLPVFGWRSIFSIAAVLDIIMFVTSLVALPEPLTFLMARPRADALARSNRYLVRCGHPALVSLPIVPARRTMRVAQLFRAGMAPVTIHIACTYLLYLSSILYIQNWLPTLIVDLGYSAAQAASVSMLMSVGGIVGGILLGVAASRLRLKTVVLLWLLAAAVLISAFGFGPKSIALLRAEAIVLGIAVFGGMIGIYAVVSRTFPVHMRASGTGFVIGVGRLAAVLSPIVAGALFKGGLNGSMVSAVMAVPALLAAMSLLAFRIDTNVRIPAAIPARSADA